MLEGDVSLNRGIPAGGAKPTHNAMSDNDYPALRAWFTAAPRRRGRVVEPPYVWPLPRESIKAIAADLSALLFRSRSMSDADLERVVFTRLECGYDSRRDGMSVRDWLESLLGSFEWKHRDDERRREREQPPAVRAARLRPSVAAEVERSGVDDLAERTRVAPEAIRGFLGGETPDFEALDTFHFYAFGPYPDLGYLMATYFYQCWNCGPGPVTWEEVVDTFIAEELPALVRGTVGDIRRLLEVADDVEVRRVLDDHDLSFSPEITCGMTDRAWLKAVGERLARAT